MPSDALSKSITERRRSKFTHSRETPQLAIDGGNVAGGIQLDSGNSSKKWISFTRCSCCLLSRPFFDCVSNRPAPRAPC